MKIYKIIFLTVAIFFSGFRPAFACQCALPPPPCYEYSESDAVFVGTVKSVKRPDDAPFPKVEVEVEKNFKGMPFKNAFTYSYPTSCSRDYKEGDKILFYADIDENDKNKFGTSLCARSQKFEENSVDFDFLNSLNAAPNYLIWGVITDARSQTIYDNQPFKNIQAQVFDDKKKLVGISDENGDLKIPVSKPGIYKVRVFPPKKTQVNFNVLINSAFEEKVKSLKDYNLKKTRPFVEYEVEVKTDKCGWFYLPLEKQEQE